MSYRYSNAFIDPGLNTLVSPSPSGSYTQFGGIWKLNAASAAQGAGTWALPPQPGLYGWGNNGIGQLGLGTITSYSSPVQVSSLTSWNSLSISIWSGRIKNDGSLWMCGQNNAGQLGLGNHGASYYYSSPKQVGSLTTWKQVVVERFYATGAIKTDGTLWTWGYGPTFGALGLGNTNSYSSPKQVGSLTNWSKLNSGFGFFMAIKTDGTLWGWGYNGSGNLGLGSHTYAYSSPMQVGALTNWANVACTESSFAAIKTDGTLWTAGAGYTGVLGLGNNTSYSSPKQVGSLTNWSKISAAGFGNFVCSIKTDGTLWAWGGNVYGNLGIGTITSYSSPIQVGSLTNWLTVVCGNYFTVALKTDGTLWTWGQNSSGQLGLGNRTNYSSPKQVGSLTTWTQATAGDNQVLAVHT